MKYPILVSVVLVAVCSTAPAQVASHAPTAIARQRAAASVSSEKPVARVNGTVLTERDLLHEMYVIFPYARQHNGGFPKSMEPEIRKGALQMIIFEELVYQDAERRGITIPPQRINHALAQFRERFGDEAEFKQYLQQEDHGSELTLKRKIRRSMLIEAELRAQIQNKSVVSVAEARTFYNANPKRFEVPESFEFQSISIIPPEHANPDQLKEARKRAEDALQKAKATKTYEQFGLLAEKISDDDYRVNMGDHHAVPRSELPPEIVKAALAMKPGEVSELIQMGNAYSIFRLNKHDLAGKRTFNEVEKQLRQELQKQKAERLRSELAKKLKAGAKVEEL